MRQVILHVGLFKTATTYLQQDIFRNLDGVHYVSRSLYNHTWLRDILSSDFLTFLAKADKVRHGFEALMGQHDKVVLSHEIFSGNPYYQSAGRYDIAAKLHHLFPDAKVILGIRGQWDLIDSLYREYVVQGGVKSFVDFALNPRRLPASILDYDPHLDLESFCYHAYVRHLAERFGRERLLVYPYESLKVDKAEFLGRICRFLEVAPRTDTLPMAVRREGLSNAQSTALRYINYLYRSAFNKRGVIPYRYTLANLLRWTNGFYDYRESFCRGVDFPVDFEADNERLDQEFDLGLRTKFRSAYYQRSRGS